LHVSKRQSRVIAFYEVNFFFFVKRVHSLRNQQIRYVCQKMNFIVVGSHGYYFIIKEFRYIFFLLYNFCIKVLFEINKGSQYPKILTITRKVTMYQNPFCTRYKRCSKNQKTIAVQITHIFHDISHYLSQWQIIHLHHNGFLTFKQRLVQQPTLLNMILKMLTNSILKIIKHVL
jgi:hypothetical protein